MPAPKPCLFVRKVLPKVWGGDALGRLYGVTGNANEGIGETWELYDRPDGSSVVRGSTTTLADLMRQDARALLGHGVKPATGGRFPLLLKFIDAREQLSVQVHPDDAQAASEGDGGKEEAWVVLQTGPMARIIRGSKPGVSADAFAAAAPTAAVEGLLQAFVPRVDDCVHIPPGVVHAIGPDVVVFEVQQNSDITYRLYDWGRPREVHVQKALAVTRLDTGGAAVVTPKPAPDGCELLLQTRPFRLRRQRFTHRTVLATGGKFLTITAIGGRGMLGWHSGGADAPLLLQAGDTALVPACVAEVFLSPIGTLQVLLCDPGMS